MSRVTITAGTLRLTPKPTGPRPSLSNLAVRLLDAIGDWAERSEQRRALAAASDQLLRDIGISRLDAEGECEKPFWRL